MRSSWRLQLFDNGKKLSSPQHTIKDTVQFQKSKTLLVFPISSSKIKQDLRRPLRGRHSIGLQIFQLCLQYCTLYWLARLSNNAVVTSPWFSTAPMNLSAKHRKLHYEEGDILGSAVSSQGYRTNHL